MPQEKQNNNDMHLNLPTYPSNSDAERSVLASMILDKSVAVEMLSRLEDVDFYNQRHKVILQAMKELDAVGDEIDFVNLTERLQRTKNLDKAGGLDYISELSSYVATAVGVSQHFEILKKLTLMRGLLNASKAIAEDVYNSDDADKCLENAQRMVLDISRSRTGDSLVHLGSVVNEVVHNYEEISASETRVTGLLTGYNNLDNAMNGLQKSDLVVLAARPGVGKTAFALSIANNIAQREPNKKILIFSLEMGSAQLAERMLCNVGKVNYNKVRHVELDNKDFVRFHRAMNVLAGSQIYLDQTAETNPEQIYSKCRQFSLEHNGVDLIIVDYLQLMDTGSGRVESRQVEVSKISRRMKLLAKQLGVPIILLSQLSRAAEQRGEKPQLFDLRDSGAIEQDADIVMFLHKERNQPVEETYIELIVAKYRAGELRSHAFRWEGSTFTFTPVDPDILRHLKKADEEGADEVKSAMPQVAKVDVVPMPTAEDAPEDKSAQAAPVPPQDNANKFSADFFDNNDGGKK